MLQHQRRKRKERLDKLRTYIFDMYYEEVGGSIGITNHKNMDPIVKVLTYYPADFSMRELQARTLTMWHHELLVMLHKLSKVST